MNYAALSPLITLTTGALLLVIAAAFKRNNIWMTALSLLTFASTLAAVLAIPSGPHTVTSLFFIDEYSRFYTGLTALCALFVTGIGFFYSENVEEPFTELFPLVCLSTLGACTIICSRHMVSFFLGLETMTIPIYVLIAYLRSRRGLEAAFKYLILASVSTAFFLLGVAFIYTTLGTFELTWVEKLGALIAQPLNPMFLAGLGLIFVGIGFKLAIVPLHLWAADIYEGAGAPVSAFIATVSKGAIFAFALRYLSTTAGRDYGALGLIIGTVAIASMFVGNWLALLQNNLKRILGFSSIAHAGYVLVAFQAGGSLGFEAVAYYLTVYFLSILGAFGVIAALNSREGEVENLMDYRGLAWRQPVLAAVLSIMMLSLAGIPFTAGFVAKFYVLSAAIQALRWPLVAALVVSTAIGVFYYLRVIVTLYSPETVTTIPKASVFSLVILSVLGFLVISLGIYPM